MKLIATNNGLDTVPFPLEEASQKLPSQVIEDFFAAMSVEDVRSQLGSLLHVAMTCDNAAFDSGLKRDAAIFFCQQLQQLAEAAFRLNARKKRTVTAQRD